MIYKFETFTQDQIQMAALKHQKWLNGESAERADFQNCTFELGLNMAFRWEKAVFSDCVFEDGFDFGEAYLSGADFTRCQMHSADLRAARMSDARFIECNLSSAKFHGGTYLRGSCFEKSTLRSANFAYSSCMDVNFDQTDMAGASFIGTSLDDTTFTHAYIKGVNWHGAVLKGSNLLYAGQDVRGHPYTAILYPDGRYRIDAGCHIFDSVAQARKHWEERHAKDIFTREDCLSLLTRLERMIYMRGWEIDQEWEGWVEKAVTVA